MKTTLTVSVLSLAISTLSLGVSIFLLVCIFNEEAESFENRRLDRTRKDHSGKHHAELSLSAFREGIPVNSEKHGLLPPIKNEEESETMEKDEAKEELELPAAPYSLPVPYSKGVMTFTPWTAAKDVSSMDSEWVGLVTTSPELEMYTDVAQPPAWCRETRTRLKDGERPPYVHQWDIVCERDGKMHRLSLFAEEGEREWHLNFRGTMVPCTLTQGTVHQGRSNIINFMNSMKNWFHECEDGRRLLFISYHVGHWYADLYFSIKDGTLLYHGSEYVSEEAAASM